MDVERNVSAYRIQLLLWIWKPIPPPYLVQPLLCQESVATAFAAPTSLSEYIRLAELQEVIQIRGPVQQACVKIKIIVIFLWLKPNMI